MNEKEKLHSMEKVYSPCEYPTDDKRHEWKSTLAQFYVTVVECIFLISLGMQIVMPTVVVGALHNKKGDPMELDDATASWIGSILYICQPAGSVASGFLSETFGRKGAMMLVNIPFFIGWILIYYAESVRGLIIATLTMGLGIGFCEAPVANYIGEISEPHLRSVFTSMVTAACIFGNTIEMFVGSVFDWRTSALISAIIPIISLVFFTTIPESPVWLITKGKMEKAQKSLARLRGSSEPHHVQKEFDDMVRYTKLSHNLSEDTRGNFDEKVPLDSEHKTMEEASGNWFKERYKELTNPKLYLPLRMIFVMFIFTQCAGLAPFKSYLVGVLNKFYFPVESRWILVMTGVMSFIGSVTTIFIVHLTGKRALTIISMTITTMTIFGLGVYTAYFSHSNDLFLSLFLITNLAVSFFFNSLGVLNIPWMFLTEIFPVRARGIASGISAAWSYFVTFVMTKTYLQMQSVLGLSGMFYLYGLISFCGVIYVYIYMPETEGKSLERIETYFTPNHDPKEKFSIRPRKEKKPAKHTTYA